MAYVRKRIADLYFYLLNYFDITRYNIIWIYRNTFFYLFQNLEANYELWSRLKGFAKSNSSLKENIEKIVISTGLHLKRPREMDIDDFLKLLLAFNKENIRFVTPSCHMKLNELN